MYPSLKIALSRYSAAKMQLVAYIKVASPLFFLFSPVVRNARHSSIAARVTKGLPPLVYVISTKSNMIGSFSIVESGWLQHIKPGRLSDYGR